MNSTFNFNGVISNVTFEQSTTTTFGTGKWYTDFLSEGEGCSFR